MDPRPDAGATGPVLALEGVTFRHRGAGDDALKGIDLAVSPGETVRRLLEVETLDRAEIDAIVGTPQGVGIAAAQA